MEDSVFAKLRKDEVKEARSEEVRAVPEPPTMVQELGQRAAGASSGNNGGWRSGPVGAGRDGYGASAAPRATGLRKIYAALADHRYYRFLWLGTIGAFVGMQMQMVARGYLTYELAGTATMLGVVSVSMALPMMLFSLIGGVAADRFPRRNIILTAQASIGLMAAIVAALIYLHLIALWHLVVLGMVQGVAFSFNMPARMALLPQLVGQRDMQNAIAINNVGMNATSIFGPALAGALIAVPFIGLGGVHVLVALCFVWAVYLLLRIPAHYQAADADPQGRRWGRNGHGRWEEPPKGLAVFSGFRYITDSPVLRMVMILGLVPNLVVMPVMGLLMPVFAKDILGPDYSLGFGLMMTAAGVGALVGSFVVAYLGSMKRQTLFQLSMGIVWGFCMIAFALSALLGSFQLMLVALALSGFASSIYMVLTSTMVFAVTDEALFGRVMGVYMMMFSVFPLATLPIGALADLIGAPIVALGAGIILTAFVGAVTVLKPGYRKLEVEPPLDWEELGAEMEETEAEQPPMSPARIVRE